MPNENRQNALLKKEPTQNQIIAGIVDRMKEQWAKVLPKILTPERFARVVLTCINKDKTLADAMMTTSGKNSVLSAFMKCAEMGLEPDGRRAALIAFKKGKESAGEQQYDITLIPMFQGLAELAMRSGMISFIHANKICEQDKFSWNIGVIEEHRPDFRSDRGNAYAYYCHVKFKDGSSMDEIMTKSEVEAIRNRSNGYNHAKKYGKENPWTTDFDEMAKKTVFRRVSKWLPLSPELVSAVEEDDKDFIDVKASEITGSRFETPQIEMSQEAETLEVQNNSEPSDLEKLKRLIEEKGIPVTAEAVKEYVESKGEIFSFDMLSPNINRIVEKMEMGE